MYVQHVYSCVQDTFWQHFCLIVSFFICINLTLPLFKKDKFVRNGYFSPTRSVSVERLFYLRLFLPTKVSQKAFNFNQIESF